MITKISSIARQSLFILAVFITFILLFESYLVIPVWLQIAGRMHPLLLHFPIVLLLLATGLQWYRFKKGATISQEYKIILREVWFFSSLLTGMTVIMGIFLSQEEGYSGQILGQHKWTGAATFYMSWALFLLHEKPFFKLIPAKVLTVALPLFVLISGHLGATLTHGADFLLIPYHAAQTQKAVTLEEAYVFDDLIAPVLNAKCTGCHNADKIKGELLLIDSAAIAKGGKSGALFNFTQPELSLLMERIHLPAEDKKHMPPKGKPQLSQEEEALLLAWIQARTPFGQKVTSLGPASPLYVLASKQLNSATTAVETYEFAEADQTTLLKLNTDYRTIVPLAIHSPALEVAVFNTQAYSEKQISELVPLKQQIVHLNLSKMPVGDQDLKSVEQLENLRELNLNFTNVTGAGLSSLTKLPHLKHLNIAGTNITLEDLKKVIPALKTIRKVTLWETAIDEKGINELSSSFPQVEFTGNYRNQDTARIRLNPAQALTSHWVFPEQSSIRLTHPVRDVQLHYTTDGTDPDSLSPSFSKDISIHTTTVIRVKGYKDGWLPSDITEFQFFKNTYKPDSVQLLNKLNHVHLAEGAHTFFDTQLGSLGANNPAWANHFAGVRNENLQLICRFDKPVLLSSVGLRHMIEEETGVYPPGLVEIWGGESEQTARLIARKNPTLPAPKEKPSLQKLDITFSPQNIRYLKIIAQPYRKGQERPKLVLIDEMFLN